MRGGCVVCRSCFYVYGSDLYRYLAQAIPCIVYNSQKNLMSWMEQNASALNIFNTV